MWISKRKWNDMEKKVATLEKKQLEAATMVKNYIENSESSANQLMVIVKSLPQKIMQELKDNGFDK